MGQRYNGPRKDTAAPASWGEVWHWADEIRDRWGYWTVVQVSPPLPSQTKIKFCVTVKLEKMSVQCGGAGSMLWRYRNVENTKLTAEFTALQLLVELHRKLDREEYEAERSALKQGALL